MLGGVTKVLDKYSVRSDKLLEQDPYFIFVGKTPWYRVVTPSFLHKGVIDYNSRSTMSNTEVPPPPPPFYYIYE